MNPVLLLLGSFFLLIMIKIPVAISLILSGMGTIIYLGLPFNSILNHMYSSVNSFTLLAVPFFLLLGSLMNEGGITQRLLNFSNAVIGHIKGGLGHVNILVSTLFAGISGSPTSDVAGIGAMLIPAMVEDGYDPDYSVAVTGASSVIAGIIPPSIKFVIYGAAGGVSIGALFLAGIIPGIMVALTQMGYTVYLANKNNYPAMENTSFKEKLVAFKESFPTLVLPLIILVGVTGGFFTATEAAAIAVIYAFILMVFVYKSYNISELPKVLIETALSASIPMFAVAGAGIMGWLIAYLNIPQYIASSIVNVTSSYLGIYTMLVLFLLLIGTVLSPITSIIIFLPIMQELGNIAGAHPVQLGIVVALCLSIGQVTPPYGICLLVAAQIGKLPTMRAFKAIIPFILLMLVVIYICILFPNVVLFLPKLIMPQYV